MQLNITRQSLSKNMILYITDHSYISHMRLFNSYFCFVFCRRLFGNRSFCFEKMQEYTKALADAELSLSMCPGWVKGLFRKGRALAGLKVNILKTGLRQSVCPTLLLHVIHLLNLLQS